MYPITITLYTPQQFFAARTALMGLEDAPAASAAPETPQPAATPIATAESVAAEQAAPAPTPATPAAQAKPQQTKEASAPAEEAEDPEDPPVTLERLRQLGHDLVKKHGALFLRQWLGGHGVTKLPECPQAKWAALTQEAQTYLEYADSDAALAALNAQQAQ